MRKFPPVKSPHPDGFTAELCRDLQFFTNSSEDRKRGGVCALPNTLKEVGTTVTQSWRQTSRENEIPELFSLRTSSMCSVPHQRRLPEAPLHNLMKYIISITTKSHMLTQTDLQEALGNSQHPYTMKTLYVNIWWWKANPAIWWRPSTKRKPTANITISRGKPLGMQTQITMPICSLHISFSSCAHDTVCVCMYECTCVEGGPRLMSWVFLYHYLISRGRVSDLNPELTCLASLASQLALSLSTFCLVALQVAHHTCLAFTWVLIIQTLPRALTTEPSPQAYLSKSYGSKQGDKARKKMQIWKISIMRMEKAHHFHFLRLLFGN